MPCYRHHPKTIWNEKGLNTGHVLYSFWDHVTSVPVFLFFWSITHRFSISECIMADWYISNAKVGHLIEALLKKLLVDLLINIYTSAKSSFEKVLFQLRVRMLMINVLLQEEGRRNRCSKKVTVKKKVVREKNCKGQRMEEWSILSAPKCSSSQYRGGTVYFWGQDNLPVSTKLHYSNFSTYHTGPQKKYFFQVLLLPFIWCFHRWHHWAALFEVNTEMFLVGREENPCKTFPAPFTSLSSGSTDVTA